MTTRFLMASMTAMALLAAPMFAQEEGERPEITIGNGEANWIITDGMTRQTDSATYSEVHVDGTDVSSVRSNRTALTFPEVMIENPGWLVLHPVIDGKPDGDIVSGFTYLDGGQNDDVTIEIGHRTTPGDRFIVMLHSDVDNDRVLDFVFVEDGINVEDTAVFEGTRMIAHMIALPE